MTNPLEQIRELADGLKIRAANLDGKPLSLKYMGKLLGYQDCASEIIAILDASQGYVCVPVEMLSEDVLEAMQSAYAYDTTEQICIDSGSMRAALEHFAAIAQEKQS